MVILFIIVVLGYALCKLGYMGDKFDQKLSSIVIDVTCPALILSSVMGTELPDRSLILPLLGVGFLTYVVLLVFGFWVPRFVSKDRDEQGMIGFALMFANVGFIGYPIVSSIFGPKAVFYAALLNMPNTFFIFTAGVMLVKGEYGVKSLNPKVLLSPAMIAAFAAALPGCRMPVCYNGDVTTAADLHTLEAQYPQLSGIMVGRGIIADPALFREARGGAPAAREELRGYLDDLYHGYSELFGSAGCAVSRMKGHWFYLIHKFEGAEKLEKQLRKVREPWEYEVVVNQIFTLPFRP